MNYTGLRWAIKNAKNKDVRKTEKERERNRSGGIVQTRQKEEFSKEATLKNKRTERNIEQDK